jgi:type II secretory pathway component GspD/PulD (secretin)
MIKMHNAPRWIAVAALTVLSACAGNDPLLEGPRRLGEKTQAERSPDLSRLTSEAVNFFREKPVTILETDGKNQFALAADPGEKVPEVVVGEINATPMQFGPLLDQIAEKVGMSWRISGVGADDLMTRNVYFVQRSDALLEDVLEELSQITNAFIRVKGDRIIVSQEELFMARVPRMSGSQKILTLGLANLGATEIFQDDLSGTVSFRATRPVREAAQRLMTSMESGRDMIVYDFWLIDRSLRDSSGLGVDLAVEGALGDFNIGVSGVSDVVSTLGGGSPITAMVSTTMGGFDIASALTFLRALGDTETLARPTISLLSGTTSTFRTGQTESYIRSTEVVATSGDTTTSGTTVQDLETGIAIGLAGAYNSGVISTDFEIVVSELLEYQEFDTGSEKLRLPKTSQREMKAHLEARPGDVMVLGGIIRDQEMRTGRDIVGLGVPTGRSAESVKTETIILVRPRLVQIRPREGVQGAPADRIAVDVSSIPRRDNAAAAVVEEEEKIRDIIAALDE